MELVDFSAAFPSAESIKRAGFGGVIGYFSASRPGANFGAKPVTREVAHEYRAAGLELVANYQFGKDKTSDWRYGFDGGVHHAKEMLRLLREAGLEGVDCVKYAPVDSNPTLHEFNTMINPFFKGWATVVGRDKVGAYCNRNVLEWLLEDNLCSYFWQHGWDGRPPNTPLVAHPAAHILQYEIDKSRIDGIVIDRNRTLKDEFGQIGVTEDEDMRDSLFQLMGPGS